MKPVRGCLHTVLLLHASLFFNWSFCSTRFRHIQGIKIINDLFDAKFERTSTWFNCLAMCARSPDCHSVSYHGLTGNCVSGRWFTVLSAYHMPIYELSSEWESMFTTEMPNYAIRYPEAVALPSIKAERVAEALVGIFSRLGVAKEILRLRGSLFPGVINVRKFPNIPYAMSYIEAVSTCVSIGSTLANPEDITTAHSKGYHVCTCGWATDRKAYLSLYVWVYGCGPAGVTECTWNSAWDATCIV